MLFLALALALALACSEKAVLRRWARCHLARRGGRLAQLLARALSAARLLL
eukprot:COSAG02_NODE_206_length_29144_cov_12.855121_13_plen_51_part_00